MVHFQPVKMSDLEDELRIVRQRLLEAETRVEELEFQQRNADQFVIQVFRCV